MRNIRRNTARMTALSALIAALYAGLTAALAPLSFGPVQFRVAEALTLLPFFIPEAVPGLFVGCLLSNMLGGFGLVDIILGSAATLLAAWLTARARNIWLAALPPVLVNALVVGGYVAILSDTPIALSMLYIGASQALICCGMGIPLALGIRRSGIIDRFMEAKRPRG